MLFFSILSQKEKFYVKNKSNTQSSCMIFFFVFYVEWTYISERLIIYESGITMNISNTQSVTMLSNLHFNLIFSVLEKSCKNEYICPSGIFISDIITSSRINHIIFSIEDFFVSSEDRKYPSIHIIWWKKKNYYFKWFW